LTNESFDNCGTRQLQHDMPAASNLALTHYNGYITCTVH